MFVFGKFRSLLKTNMFVIGTQKVKGEKTKKRYLIYN